MSVIMTGCFLKWQDASWNEELTDKRAFSVNENKYEDEFGKFSYINDVPADSMEAREYYVRDILSSYGITVAEVRLETGSVISLKCEKYVSRENLENIEYGYGEESEYGWEIDHVLPLSKGGTHDISNLEPLQWQNNRTKGDNYPHWNTKITSSDVHNTELTRCWYIKN